MSRQTCLTIPACIKTLVENVEEKECWGAWTSTLAILMKLRHVQVMTVFTPVVELGEELIMCEESLVLAAGNGGASYLWSNGETTSEIDVTIWRVFCGSFCDSGLPADAAAIDGFQHIGSFEQSHYYVRSIILWEEAKINCELLGGHLVTISSEEENELVWQGVYANGLNPGGSNNYQAWIGLYHSDSPDYSEPAGGWEWSQASRLFTPIGRLRAEQQ